MNLTPIGAQVAMMGATQRAVYGDKLVAGLENINKYTTGVCYDAAAYVRYLLGARTIIPDDIVLKSGQDWLATLDFQRGHKWNGRSAILSGKAVGFYRLVDRKFFHAAIATGGTIIRAVNGNRLGAGWIQVDMKRVLGEADSNGQFEYDRTKIEVFISTV